MRSWWRVVRVTLLWSVTAGAGDALALAGGQEADAGQADRSFSSTRSAIETVRRSPAQEEIRSYLFFLFDDSESFHVPDPAESRLLAVLPKLDETLWTWVAGSAGAPQLPWRVFVGTIGTLSRDQHPVCAFTVGRPTIVASQLDSVAVASNLPACLADLRAVPPARGTDMTSSLGAVALNLDPAARALKGIVVVSDLAADPPVGRGPATPDLTGRCVAVMYSSSGDSAVRRDAQVITRRRVLWQAALAEWGAVDSAFWMEAAYTAPELGRFFQRCGLAGATGGEERESARIRNAERIREANDLRAERARTEAEVIGLTQDAREVLRGGDIPAAESLEATARTVMDRFPEIDSGTAYEGLVDLRREIEYRKASLRARSAALGHIRAADQAVGLRDAEAAAARVEQAENALRGFERDHPDLVERIPALWRSVTERYASAADQELANGNPARAYEFIQQAERALEHLPDTAHAELRSGIAELRRSIEDALGDLEVLERGARLVASAEDALDRGETDAAESLLRQARTVLSALSNSPGPLLDRIAAVQRSIIESRLLPQVRTAVAEAVSAEEAGDCGGAIAAYQTLQSEAQLLREPERSVMSDLLNDFDISGTIEGLRRRC